MASTSSVRASAPATVNEVSSSVAPVTVRPKNAAGNKSDPAWEYAISIDLKSRRVKCKLCNLEFTGNAFRIKHHLAGTNSNVRPCTTCPPELRQKMLAITDGLQEKLLKKIHVDINIEGDNRDADVSDGATGKRKSQVELQRNNMYKRGLTQAKQTTINGAYKKGIRDDACKDIALFFYNNAIPFNVARSDEYLKMFDNAIKHGFGFQPPSYHEIRVKYLDYYYGEISKVVAGYRADWEKYGCTIMTDVSIMEDEEDEEDEGDDISLDVGQDVSIGDVLGDDLELPPIDEEDDDAVEVEENEDEDDDLDDYQDFGLDTILNI
ncbi:hypothetical protein TSUD_302180 [Trifolium subterraneum]|uniref:BED-type domain-containing protein n=1 Tax=Trifolium subterraneum TaxID=3900 RepID=A0A2Z6PBP2_TRISU|nr:hypothetical protein TSUD_302180 [Trifolium subterraneum]